jgi:hypothetical protein
MPQAIVEQITKASRPSMKVKIAYRTGQIKLREENGIET